MAWNVYRSYQPREFFILPLHVYAELGEVVNGDKPGRTGNEIIVVDLTGTGAQDAAIGQVAWDKLSQL